MIPFFSYAYLNMFILRDKADDWTIFNGFKLHIETMHMKVNVHHKLVH